MARFGAATHADLCRDINEGAAAFDAECGVGTLADGLVAVVLRSCKAHVAWVGDSRCYLLRDAGLRQFKPTLSFTVPLQAADRLLACSAGLHGFLPTEVMVRTLASGDDAAGIAQKLVELTLEQTPAGDNVTALCILVNGP